VVEATNVGPVTIPSKTTFDDLGTLIRTEYHGPLTKVRIELPEGIYATGWSRQNEGDIYNSHFGETLAQVRASQRVLRKYEKWLAKNGNATKE
jgi:hypothetical protein